MDQLVRRATTHGRAHMNSYGAMPAPKQSKASDLTLFSVGEVPRVQCQTGSLFLCVGSKRRPSRGTCRHSKWGGCSAEEKGGSKMK